MGQQDSKPQVADLSSPKNINYQTKKNTSTENKGKNNFKLMQCEGLLKLQSIPFKNCIQIQTQNEILFLENVQITLKYLLETRLHTNKLFTIEDLEKLIETLTFTLAFLQENGITYKDIHAENIFYDNGSFKLLPNQLIQLNSYQRFKENGEVYPSPEYIIALRCGEQRITDDDIIQKSNVFILGMNILEVATLLPSVDCYDPQNFDILDSIINERITLVEEYYGQKVAKIIANMLDYDYTERMNLKQLSIWVNRQLNISKITQNSIVQNHNNMSCVDMSKVDKQFQQKSASNSTLNNFTDKSKPKSIKSNSIYIDFKKETELNRENKVYIKDNNVRLEQVSRTISNDENRYVPKKYEYLESGGNKLGYDRQAYNEVDNFKGNEQGSNRPLKSNQIYQEKGNYSYNGERRQTAYDKGVNERQTATKRITKEQLKMYKSDEDESLNGVYIQKRSGDNSMQEKVILRQIGNQFYPKVDELFKSKGYSKQEVKGGVGENGSLNRIKEEILKSRKLIQQFKRSEGLKY